MAADPTVHLPPPTDVADLTPNEPTTPESYLGYQHGTPNLAGQTVVEDQMAPYPAPGTVPADEYAYGGQLVHRQRGLDGRAEGHPVARLPGPGRLPGPRWDRHRQGLGQRASRPGR